MRIDEFQLEIEKLSHLLDEMKQLSVFRDAKYTEKETAGNRCYADGISIKTKNGETILDFHDGILTLGKAPRHS